MRFGVLDGHFGKPAEGDNFAAHQFGQLDLVPRIGFALLLEREGIAFAANFLSMPLSFDMKSIHQQPEPAGRSNTPLTFGVPFRFIAPPPCRLHQQAPNEKSHLGHTPQSDS